MAHQSENLPTAPPAFIVFDLDGTVVDSADGIVWSFEATLRDFDRPIDRSVLATLIGPPLHDSFSRLGFGPDLLGDALNRYRAHYGEEGVYRCRLYDGVPALLDTIGVRGIPALIATAKRVDFASRMLESLGVAEYFAVVAGAALDGRRSPKADIVSEALTKFAPASPRGWMVGDRHFDMEAARSNRLLGGGATWGYGTVAELRESGATWLIDEPSALGRLVDDLFTRSPPRDRP